MTIPSPAYRLKPKAGDANPYNEVGGGNVLSGATTVLTDRGGGDYAWRFSGGTCLATGVNIPYDKGAAAGGIVMILTLKVVTGPSIDFTRYAQCNLSSDSNTYLGVTQNGAGNARSRFSNSSAGGSSFSIGTTETTLAIRIKSNGAGTETIDTWKKTVGRVGTAADGTQTGLATLNATFNQVLAGGGDSSVVDIKDLAFYVGEPTDAEMASLADAYRATVDTGATVTLVGAAQTGGPINGTGPVTVTPPSPGVVNLAGSIQTGGPVNGTGAIAVIPVQGTVTSPQFYNYSTGAPLAGVTVPIVTFLNMAGHEVLQLANQVTNGAGRLVMQNIALTPGVPLMMATFDPSNPDPDTQNRGFKRVVPA